jgi:hypothetical protein
MIDNVPAGVGIQFPAFLREKAGTTAEGNDKG